MSEIPEDVEAKATAAFIQAKRGASAINCIARAILAERKRCAEIALANAHADCEVAEQIAREIEAGA